MENHQSLQKIALMSLYGVMLASLPNNFEGGMRLHKYTRITKTTRITASRDLADLVKKGIMKKYGSGCGVYYELAR